MNILRQSTFRLKLKHICVFFAVAMFTTLSPAQLTRTVTTARSSDCPTNLPTNQTFYSNWVYEDPSAVKHSFSGETLVETKLTFSKTVGHTIIQLQCGVTLTTSLNEYSTDGLFHLQATGPTGVVTVPGLVSPKYVILNVVYAPPGSHSSVDYSNSTLVGSSSTYTSSFQTMSMESFSVGLSSGSIFGIFGNEPDISVTATQTQSFTQEQDSSSTISINKTTSFDNIIGGPASDFSGADHTQDQVYIWLNPILNFTVFPSSAAVQFNGYSFDLNDPVSVDGNLDIVHLTIAELKNPSLIDPATLKSLSRTWAAPMVDGSAPALTNQDLLNIAAADPFSNPSYTPSFTVASAPCSTDGRFCNVTSVGQPIQYMQNPGGSPSMQKFSQGYQKIATDGQGFKDTHSESYSIDISLKNGFLGIFNTDFKAGNTLTWSNGYSTTSTNTTGQSASVSIVGPQCTGNPCSQVYTGPTQFNTYEDTVYKTFMFFGVN